MTNSDPAAPPTDQELLDFAETMPAPALRALECLEEASPPGRGPRVLRLVYEAAARVRAVHRPDLDGRRFPLIVEQDGPSTRHDAETSIPWAVAELALVGAGSRVDEVEARARRGGLTPDELDELLVDWRTLARREDRIREVLAAAERRAEALEADLGRARAARNACISEARGWAQEARTHRATVLEVGETLGGLPDWGPIAAGVRACLAERRALIVFAQRLDSLIPEEPLELSKAAALAILVQVRVDMRASLPEAITSEAAHGA